MVFFKRLLTGLALAVTVAPATASAATPTKPPSKHALLTSRELWATINVCDAPDQANTIGIRGSMPSDGYARDHMYMSFRLQYLNPSKHWVDLATGTGSGYVAIPGGVSARQGGSSFELKPVPGKAAVTLRGVVDFQWRRGKTVLLSAARPTSAGHRSLAGADPADYSAATCVIR